MSEGVLTAAYDRIEALATAVHRSARIQAQAVREEKASRRLQALLPASGAEGLGGAGLGVASDGSALGGPVLGGPAPVGSAATAPASSGAAAHPGHSRPAGGRSGPITAGRDGAVPALPPAGRRHHRRCTVAGGQSGRLGTSYIEPAAFVFGGHAGGDPRAVPLNPLRLQGTPNKKEPKFRGAGRWGSARQPEDGQGPVHRVGPGRVRLRSVAAEGSILPSIKEPDSFRVAHDVSELLIDRTVGA